MAKHDIGFSVAVVSTDAGGWEQRRELVEPVRLFATDGVVTGEHLFESAREGEVQTCTFFGDNSYSKMKTKSVSFQLLIETIVGTPRARTAPDTDTMPFGGFGGRTSTTTDDLVARARSNSSSSDSESSLKCPPKRTAT